MRAVLWLVVSVLAAGCATRRPGDLPSEPGFTRTQLPRLAVGVTARVDVENALGAGDSLDGDRLRGYRVIAARVGGDAAADEERELDPARDGGETTLAGRAVAVPVSDEGAEDGAGARVTAAPGLRGIGAMRKVEEYSLVVAYDTRGTLQRYAFVRIWP